MQEFAKKNKNIKIKGVSKKLYGLVFFFVLGKIAYVTIYKKYISWKLEIMAQHLLYIICMEVMSKHYWKIDFVKMKL